MLKEWFDHFRNIYFGCHDVKRYEISRKKSKAHDRLIDLLTNIVSEYLNPFMASREKSAAVANFLKLVGF